MNTQTTDRTAEALAKLEAGIKNLANDEEWRRYLACQAAFHDYSFSNTMLILAQRPDATKIAGLKTWNKLGRHVQKGERALWILAPVFGTKKAEPTAQERQEDTADDDRRIVCFRSVAVFDVAQTEGQELPTPVRKLTGDTAGDLFERLAAFSEANGCPVTVEAISGGANGFYSPAEHRIVIRTGLAPDQAAKTLAHEIAHSILHRDIEAYRAHRPDMELEAESVAFVVLAHFAVDAGAYSFGYISSWQDGSEAAIKSLKTSAAKIQTTAKAVIDGLMAADSTEVEAA